MEATKKQKKITFEMMKKFLDNQRLIKKHLKGKISKKQLNDAGVRLAKPI